MAALTVAEDLEKSEYRVDQLDPCRPFLPIQQLDLHARPEGFLSIELSEQSPIVPKEGISPKARIVFLNAHSEAEFRVHPSGTIGLPRGRVNLPDQSGQSLPSHLSRRQDAVLVCVIPGAADAEKPAADIGPVARLHQGADYRVNALGPGDPPPAVSPQPSECRPLFRAAGSVSPPSPTPCSPASLSRVILLDRSDPGEPNYG